MTTNDFRFEIPRSNDTPLPVVLKPGDVVYALGANGSGKSSLVSRVFASNHARAKRISAHRQTWFQSNALNMTPSSRETHESHIRAHDAQENARHRLQYGEERAGLAIFDLIDADNQLARTIAELVRAGKMAEAGATGKLPAPLQVMNELMRLSNMPIEISLAERQKVFARKNGGPEYSVAELSDGERNAFLIAADVLTAKPETLLVIDEPERHLHRSIISPLLAMLFEKRRDCAFFVSTHELLLPLDTPSATTLLVRDCEYEGKVVKAWTVDLVPPGASIDESVKRDLLGSRRKIIFVEGDTKSLDLPLYSLLFPEVSVVPKDGCRDVEHAVRGLQSAADMHWVSAWGIVDNDQRSADDVEKLREVGIWALTHYSVESLYFHSNVLRRVAARHAKLTGANSAELLATAFAGGIAAAKDQREHLISSAVLRSARGQAMSQLPTRAKVAVGTALTTTVDIAALRSTEESRFDKLIASGSWDGLIARYPLRESSAFDRIVKGIDLSSRQTYQKTVLQLLQDDADALSEMRALLGGLYPELSKA